jgi:hypothetical protein
MTTQERNKQIALMLGTKGMKEIVKQNNQHYPNDEELKFDGDWNWLMEAVEFIEKLKGMSIYIGKNRMNKLHSVEISYEDNTWQKRPHIDKTIFIQNELKKEAIFIAVSDFAKLYNNKEL